MKGYEQGDMKPEVKDWQKPDACFAEKYDQAPLSYVERNSASQKKAASKIKEQKFKGRY